MFVGGWLVGKAPEPAEAESRSEGLKQISCAAIAMCLSEL